MAGKTRKVTVNMPLHLFDRLQRCLTNFGEQAPTRGALTVAVLNAIQKEVLVLEGKE